MQEEMMKYVKTVQRQLNSMLVDSLAVIGLFRGLDLKSSSMELSITNQMDLGQNCRKNFAEFRRKQSSSFRGTRGALRSKENFNGSTQNIELHLHMVISVNQLSIYGAVADMIEELPVGQSAVENPKAPGQLDKV